MSDPALISRNVVPILTMLSLLRRKEPALRPEHVFAEVDMGATRYLHSTLASTSSLSDSRYDSRSYKTSTFRTDEADLDDFVVCQPL